jgi:transposase
LRESKRNRKRRRNLKQLHRDLVALGFDGSYDRVAAFARDWRQRERERAHQASRGAYVPLVFAPGEAFQFDWSEDWLVVGRKKTKLQIAHTKLCHSRAFHLRAYLTRTHEMLFDAHNHALRVLGGVPERGIYDNMKTAVDKVGRGKKKARKAGLAINLFC